MPSFRDPSSRKGLPTAVCLNTVSDLSSPNGEVLIIKQRTASSCHEDKFPEPHQRQRHHFSRTKKKNGGIQRSIQMQLMTVSGRLIRRPIMCGKEYQPPGPATETWGNQRYPGRSQSRVLDCRSSERRESPSQLRRFAAINVTRLATGQFYEHPDMFQHENHRHSTNPGGRSPTVTVCSDTEQDSQSLKRRIHNSRQLHHQRPVFHLVASSS